MAVSNRIICLSLGSQTIRLAEFGLDKQGGLVLCGYRASELMADPAKQMAFGKAGRQRAQDVFSWSSIAAQTRDLYETL